MRSIGQSPSLTPRAPSTVYLVLCDFGSLGRSYVETDEQDADLETVVRALFSGQYRKPIRVDAFNTAEGWARDASTEVAWAVVKMATAAGEQLTPATQDFVEAHIAEPINIEA